MVFNIVEFFFDILLSLFNSWKFRIRTLSDSDNCKGSRFLIYSDEEVKPDRKIPVEMKMNLKMSFLNLRKGPTTRNRILKNQMMEKRTKEVK